MFHSRKWGLSAALPCLLGLLLLAGCGKTADILQRLL